MAPSAPSGAGRRRAKFFQHLTTNVGCPKLRGHLGSVVTVMKLSDNYPEFKTTLDRLHPRYGETPQLPFDIDDTGRGLYRPVFFFHTPSVNFLGNRHK